MKTKRTKFGRRQTSKGLACVLAFVLMLSTLVGCSSTKAYTFSVTNGDSVKVSLDTANNYDISSSVPFEISCEGVLQSQGTFVDGGSFEQYQSIVESDENAELIDSGEKDGNQYIFWCYNGSEYNFAIRVANSNTGVVIGNLISEESAKECFQRLTISATEK